MISLQSHNQVLYHLTQLTSAFSPKTTAVTRSRVQSKQDERLCQVAADELCPESLLEAVKNYTELHLNDLLLAGTLTSPPRSRCPLEQIYIGRPSRPLGKRGTRRISYVSGESFDENKRGSRVALLLESVPLSRQHVLSGRVQSGRINQNIWVRGFKTHRSIDSEIERNPTLVGRLVRKLKLWTGHTAKSAENAKDLQFEKHAATVEQLSLNTIKTLLDDKELTKDEKKRSKVAFAEGYLAGYERKVPKRTARWLQILIQVAISFTVTMAILFIAASANGNMFRIPIARHGLVDPQEINVTFDDVKGVDDAKKELEDVVEFLKNPDKFSSLGGKLPKGVLLVGPPGTGKTLLARAVAGEAGVPFFHAAGPEFDEVLVGQGARRVRDLFKIAKEYAPCVIFIDEIDSVGAKRTNSLLHPYANQTINQLLTEMDGFHANEGVIVLGATNRPGELDKALMRPGRFDVQIYVSTPDFLGRKAIFSMYLKKVLTDKIDVEHLARSTTGFTGAAIENMVNQAALRAAIEGADSVTMKHLETAKDKVMLGPERTGRQRDPEVDKITAYHEAGHAIVALFTKDSLLLNKVTIIPRGASLGLTSYLPLKDYPLETKSQMLARMDSAMGGRAAEEIVFGPDRITTGALQDFQHATALAEHMVRFVGMSEKVGHRHYTSVKNEGTIKYSPNTVDLIDVEVKRLLQESYDRAKNLLKKHSTEHKLLAEALLKYETLNLADVKAIISGEDPKIEMPSGQPPSETKQPPTESRQPPIIEVPTNVLQIKFESK